MGVLYPAFGGHAWAALLPIALDPGGVVMFAYAAVTTRGFRERPNPTDIPHDHE